MADPKPPGVPSKQGSAGSKPRSKARAGRIRLLIARAFGVTQAMRDAVITSMLHNHQKSRVLYWLPLMLAVGIATLGLALGSTAVVIGAMLVSPLMGPIVEVGMGLAIGSPMMVLNASWRTAASIAAVVLGSAALTYLLPYQQMTAEIAARTSPTALDLVLAGFCGLAASYTTIRDHSDVVSTAAGTAIAIALVPPLCVTGWSLATGHYSAAFGSALLFVANLCAIIAVAVVLFMATAFGRADVERLENEAGNASVTLDRFASKLRNIFGSRYGWTLRYAMPATLMGAVSIPLWTALTEVSWQVEVRAAVEEMIGELPEDSRPVNTALKVERGTVVVRLVFVDSGVDVEDLRRRLRARIIAVSRVENPTVEVVQLPNYEALQALVTREAEAVLPTGVDLVAAHQRISQTIDGAWPDDADGRVTDWSIQIKDSVPTVRLVHLGDPIGEVALSMLEKQLSQAMSTTMLVEEHAVSLQRVMGEGPADVQWVAELRRAIDEIVAIENLHLCIEIPPTPDPIEPALEDDTDEPSADTPTATQDEESEAEPPDPMAIAEILQRRALHDALTQMIDIPAKDRIALWQAESYVFRRSTTPCEGEAN